MGEYAGGYLIRRMEYDEEPDAGENMISIKKT